VRTASRLAASPPGRDRLVRHERGSGDDAVGTRRFELAGNSINGKDMDLGRIDEVVVAGSSEIWEVHNGSGTPHSFHPHGVSFSVMRYAGERPPPHLQGPKDTVYVPPGTTVRVLIRFGADADPDTPYMFHCHILQHEDRGMMGQFVVVDSSREADAILGTHPAHGS
jgi:FtsP/CotA-like multicopper oxidase with cupredoxin domain